MDQLRSVLDKHVPESAVDYCHQLWQQYPFHFKLSKKRSSKLGDYRFNPSYQSHTVTVNADLNPYQFLITYVHEVAHRVAHKHRSRQKPHGPEWKLKFRELMLPVLRPEIFPEEVLRTLERHMRNPKASTAGDPELVRVLANYDEGTEATFTLSDLPLGEEFLFHKRSFRKLEKKRTRSVCLDLENNKKYLIPEMATITPTSEIVKPVRLLLSSLEAGKEFTFKQRPFRKLEIKGKRSLCMDLSDNTVYSIPESIEVSRDKS